jgi:hypothetical protein
MTSTTSPAPTSSSASGVGRGDSFTDRLADLKERAGAATDRARAARRAIDTGRFDTAQEVAAPLVKYRDDIDFKRPDATPVEERPARERELTDQFLDAVRERGLVVTVLGSTGGAVAVVDPAIYRELEEAEAEAADLNRQIRDLERAHGDDLERERKAAEAERIKDALAGDDADAIRDALSSRLSDAEPAALTSSDLVTSRRRG